VIESITGRQDDVFVSPDGRSVGRLGPIFKGAKGIVEAQLVQTAPTSVTLNLVVGEGFDQAVQASVIEELHKRLGQEFLVKVVLLSGIPKGPGGKFRTFVRAFDPPSDSKGAGA